jgi:hypothetical protein
MATFTLLVSTSGPYWLRVETNVTNERDLVKFLMNSWSKDQCHLNFLEEFLTEYSPEALLRIFPEGSVAAPVAASASTASTTSVAASATASVNSERSHSSSMLDDDEEIDDDEEEDDSDGNKEGPDDDEEDEEDDLNSDDDIATDIIMTPANTYEMTTIQREMFVDEIQEACQPVQARKQFFEMCRLNSPSIVFIKPDGLL